MTSPFSSAAIGWTSACACLPDQDLSPVFGWALCDWSSVDCEEETSNF